MGPSVMFAFLHAADDATAIAIIAEYYISWHGDQDNSTDRERLTDVMTEQVSYFNDCNEWLDFNELDRTLQDVEDAIATIKKLRRLVSTLG